MMTSEEKNNTDTEREENRKNKEPQKIWETPKLKVLPVPNRTQGGTFPYANFEGGYYRPS